MDLNDIIKFFEDNIDEKNLETMARLKVGSDKKYGIKMPVLRKLAKEIGKDHELALELWNHGYHESRLLATLIEDSSKVSEEQLDKWVDDFDTWDIVDQACINILVKMPQAISKIPLWAESDKEFVKRTTEYYDYLLSEYEKEGKMQVIVGIGCTGGQHRSVTLTNYFANYYSQYYQVYKYHRDADH